MVQPSSSRSRRSLAIAAGALGVMLGVVPWGRAWEVTEYKGRGYVTVDEVAEFYGFGEVGGDGKAFVLKREGIELRGREGTKAIEINRLTFYLSYAALPWGEETLISVFDVSHLIEPVLRPPRTAGARELRTVVIDPAHGGDEPGVRSDAFGDEKDITLAVAEALAGRLTAAGFGVVLTREGDETRSPAERAQVAADAAVGGTECVFLSLHLSGADEVGAMGVETYTLAPSGTPATYDPEGTKPDLSYYLGNLHEMENTALATAVHGSLVGRAGVADRGVRRARFEELRAIAVPGVAVRLGCLSHPDEGAALAGAGHREKLAAALAAAVGRYAAYLEQGRVREPAVPPVLALDDVAVTVPAAIDPAMEEERALRATIRTTAAAVGDVVIDPSLVDIQVYFFDRVGDDVLEPSAAEPPRIEWFSILPDWKGEGVEELGVSYGRRPAPGGSAARHTYFGAVVRLLYDGEVQATFSDPPRLERSLPQFYPIKGG